MSGWVVYIDSNNNNILDAGETTTNSNLNGDFSFTNLAFIGGVTYVVRELVQSGWSQTAPSSQAHIITLSSLQPEAFIRDFGNSQGAVLGISLPASLPRTGFPLKGLILPAIIILLFLVGSTRKKSYIISR